MKAWTLKGKTIGQLYQEEAYTPVQLPEDGHCLNCGDSFPSLDIVEGFCFGCDYLIGGTRLDNRFKARGF